MVILKIF